MPRAGLEPAHLSAAHFKCDVSTNFTIGARCELAIRHENLAEINGLEPGRSVGVALKINFTKDALRDLVCPEGKSEIYVYDTHTKGLALRVTKAGGKTFKDQRRKIDVFDYKSTKLPVIREVAEKIYANLDVILVEEHKRA